jgi:hypothetical protein
VLHSARTDRPGMYTEPLSVILIYIIKIVTKINKIRNKHKNKKGKTYLKMYKHTHDTDEDNTEIFFQS